MKSLKFVGFLLSWFFITTALSQSNPGYLGSTQVVEVSTNMYIPGIMAHGPYVKNHMSIAYEKSMDRNFSLRGGIRQGSGTFDVDKHDLSYYSVVKYDEFGSSEYTSPSSGTLGYSLTEFFIAPRWYNTESGALAPFGSFWGLELAFASVGIDDKIKWSSQAIKMPAINNGFSTVSFAIQWGHRRVLFDKFCWDYHMGLGFNVYNTGNADVSIYGEGTEYTDHEAIVHSMILEPLAWGRIFHGGLGVSYLF